MPRPRRRGRLAGALLLVPDALVVAVVGVGLAAVVLPPRPYWWAQLVAIGLPYATWALAALGVVWALLRRWGAAALHAALVALVVARAAPVDRLGAPGERPGDLVVTTFNVPQVGPSREALGDSVVGFVRRTTPDVLALQDSWVFGPSERSRREPPREQAVQVEAVTGALPYRLAVPARLAGHPGWRANATGVPVLVREGAGVEVVEQEALVLGVERDADVSLALRTRLRWGGREAVLYNVHLRSFGASKPWADRDVRLFGPSTWLPYLRRYRTVFAQRGDEVEEIAQRIEAETAPVVVVGDFNSTADNWAYHRLRTAGPDRADAVRAAGGRDWGRTYHADRPFVRIDYVLADPALEVTAARTLPVAFSDHRPVRVALRWREPPAGGSAAARDGRASVNPASRPAVGQTPTADGR